MRALRLYPNRFVVFLLFLVIPACARHEDHRLIKVLRASERTDTLRMAAYAVHDSLVSVESLPETFVASRFGKITKFPCLSCHTQPLGQMKSTDIRRAHWDIELHHVGAENVMSCLTCHSEDNLNVLHRINGDSISFNSSYELCGQCHFNQLRDWKGGAHGKRTGGWTAPRTVYTCVQCHNPHQPAFDKRWPAIPSNLMDRLRAK